MLMSIGYRFQQRLTTDFIQQMNQIDDEDEFYQVMRRCKKNKRERSIDESVPFDRQKRESRRHGY